MVKTLTYTCQTTEFTEIVVGKENDDVNVYHLTRGNRLRFFHLRGAVLSIRPSQNHTSHPLGLHPTQIPSWFLSSSPLRYVTCIVVVLSSLWASPEGHSSYLT